mgnify:CR=1 FL=1
MQKVKKKNWEKLLAAIVMTVAMLGFNLFLQPSATAECTWPSQTIPQSAQTSETVSINVKLNGEEIYDIQNVPWIENETVSLAMKNAKCVDSNFTYEVETDCIYGDFVTTIGGESPGEGKFWKLFINGEASQTGMDTTILTPNQQIEWQNEVIPEPISQGRTKNMQQYPQCECQCFSGICSVIKPCPAGYNTLCAAGPVDQISACFCDRQ